MAISDVSAMLQQGIEAAKRGDKTTATDLLQQVVEVDERNEQAWLWLSGVVESPEDVQVCLENVLEINPNNARAAAGLSWLQKQAAPTIAPHPDGAGGNGSSAPLPSSPASTETFFPPPAAPLGQVETARAFDQPVASPFAASAAPFGQQPATASFAQAAASSLGQSPAPPTNGGPQYLPFGQAVPPPRVVDAPAPPPPAAPFAAEPEANPFVNRRTPSGALASRLNSSTTTDSSDLSALRSTLFGGAPASGSDDGNRVDYEPQTSHPANPFATPASGSDYPDAATSNPFAARSAANPFASMATAGANPFASATATNDNPYGISSELQPFSLQDAQELPANEMQSGNGSANYSLQAPPADRDAHAASPFDPSTETRPPLFAPRAPLGDAPPRPSGLTGRAGLADLMSRNPATSVPPDSEVARPSSPMLIARPPLPGGRTSATADVATFPCPNCRKLVAENSLSCPSCTFQFYARCPNCSEYVDTTVPSNPRGDHCTNCGIVINLMELGRAGSATSAVTVSSGSIRPRSTASMGDGMTLMTEVKGLTSPAGKPRRSGGRLVYQLLVLLVFIGIIFFLLWAKDNLKLTQSASHSQFIPTLMSSLTSDARDINLAHTRLMAAVSHLDDAPSLMATLAAQQRLSDAAARLALDLDRADASLSYAALPGAPSWYAQYLAKQRTWVALDRTSLAHYQQALNKSAPLWAFLDRYYAWVRDSGFNLSSLGAPQAVSNSVADPAQRDTWLARQRDAANLSVAARQAAAAATCPTLTDLAAELDNLAQLYGLRAAVITDLLDLDASAARQATAAVQTLIVEMKAQAFYHPSLFDAATLSGALQGWYASDVADIYDHASAAQDEANQLHAAASRQFASQLADDGQFAPIAAADRPNPPPTAHGED